MPDSQAADTPPIHQVTTADDRRTEVEKEYGTYRAVAAIDHGNARAFNVGDPVPASSVLGDPQAGPGAWVQAEAVAKVTTKAAKAAVSEAGGLTLEG